METNKEVPTEILSPDAFLKTALASDGKAFKADEWLVIMIWMEEYANYKTKLHLSKQAEVIAESHTSGCMECGTSRESILQASEEYINNLK